MPRNASRARRDRRYIDAVTRQAEAIERDKATGRRGWYADVDEFLRPGDRVGTACVDPSCPDYGDPDFGEGTCPAEHAGPVVELQHATGR